MPAGQPSSALTLLRDRLRLVEAGGAARARGTLPFGDRRVDSCLPGQGLPLGRLHEIAAEGVAGETGAVGAAFAAGLLARLSGDGAILWAFVRDDLHGPGLAAYGLHPDRVLLVAARDDDEALAVLEEGLRTAGVAAVLGEIGRFGLTAGRRLQLACERSGATAFVLRRWPHGRARGQPLREPSAAVTRWLVAAEPSAPAEPGLGPPRWRVELRHCRGGRTGSWMMEAADATGSLRVVAELADRPAAAPPLAARAAG